MIGPDRLLVSAKRIYQDQMDDLWGEFIPVPENRINSLQDNDAIYIEDLVFRALDTPGHSNHHMSYLLDGICFSGDVGGVRIQGTNTVRLPTVPPEFHISNWRKSINRLRKEPIRTIATTHFGIHNDAEWHLNAIEHYLDEIETWMESIMPGNPSQDDLRKEFRIWIFNKAKEAGLSSDEIEAYEIAISSQMSADGIYRFWHKFRNN
jgi:glyoxylase-like metal-dependent hydrolase (beta-lactamase superfamily II)